MLPKWQGQSLLSSVGTYLRGNRGHRAPRIQPGKASLIFHQQYRRNKPTNKRKRGLLFGRKRRKKFDKKNKYRRLIKICGLLLTLIVTMKMKLFVTRTVRRLTRGRTISSKRKRRVCQLNCSRKNRLQGQNQKGSPQWPGLRASREAW